MRYSSLLLIFLCVNSFPVNNHAAEIAKDRIGQVKVLSQPDKRAPERHLDGMTLVWSDEFNGTGRPDTTKWQFETGFCRNHEDQWYQENNAYLDGKGALVIEGRKERVLNPAYQSGNTDWRATRQYAEYTSASMQSKYIYKYGKVVVRAKVPVASGSWPAIWQVGNTWEWPLGGEIDMMEYYPFEGKPAIHANFCWSSNEKWSSNWKSVAKPLSYFTDKDKDWIDKYHIWTLDWNEDSLKISLDGELLNEISTTKTVNGNGGGAAGGHQNPFSNEISSFGDLIWLNLALGGDNGGKIDDSAFPIKYYIDYVRVYQYTKN
nr:glycoside hydrolase family 16 protein [uncultured Prevotella sp.]